MTNNSFKVLFIVYILAIAADLGSTLINWELIKYLEANPLYQFGGLPLIILLNLLVAGVYWWAYSNSKNPATRFMITYSLVAIIVTRILVIKANLGVHADFVANPTIVLEAAKQVTQSQKMEYVTRYAVLNILPMLNGVITFLFFRKDHKIEVKE